MGRPRRFALTHPKSVEAEPMAGGRRAALSREGVTRSAIEGIDLGDKNDPDEWARPRRAARQ
jgi:hypothetical protein